jgi:hypothetical protein
LQVVALVLVAVVVGEVDATALAWVVRDAHGFTNSRSLRTAAA